MKNLLKISPVYLSVTMVCALFLAAGCSKSNHQTSSATSATDHSLDKPASDTKLIADILAKNTQDTPIDKAELYLAGTPIGDAVNCSLYVGSQKQTQESPYDFNVEAVFSTGAKASSETTIAPYPERGWTLNTTESTFAS